MYSSGAYWACVEARAGSADKRWAATGDDDDICNEQREGIGRNERAAEYTAGGSLMVAIIGAIARGGMIAAIGAAAGAGGREQARRSYPEA